MVLHSGTPSTKYAYQRAGKIQRQEGSNLVDVEDSVKMALTLKEVRLWDILTFPSIPKHRDTGISRTRV